MVELTLERKAKSTKSGPKHNRSEWRYIGVFSTDFGDFIGQELDQLSRLESNWDGEGAQPIDPAIIAASKAFAQSLQYQPTGRPRIVPLADGTLQLEWHDHGRSLELEIENPQRVRFLKWDPAAIVQDEGVYDIKDSETTQSLIGWFWSAGIAVND